MTLLYDQVSKFQAFYGSEGSLPDSQGPTAGPYFEPDESRPCPHPVSSKSILISTHRWEEILLEVILSVHSLHFIHMALQNFFRFFFFVVEKSTG